MTINNDNSNNNPIVTINWNRIINQDTRSIDDADLGKFKGLYEPFIVIEGGIIKKYKLYIPKSVIEKNDADVLYLNITRQEAMDTYRRGSLPAEDEIRQIEIITENRILASRSKIKITKNEPRQAEKEQRQQRHPNNEEKKMMTIRIINKIKKVKENVVSRSTKSILMLRIDKKGTINRIKEEESELKYILILAAKVAKEKIWKLKYVTEERIKRTTRNGSAYVKRKIST
jgi:hypothetical protein